MFPIVDIQWFIAAIKAGTLFDSPCEAVRHVLNVLNWSAGLICPAAFKCDELTEAERGLVVELHDLLASARTATTAGAIGAEAGGVRAFLASLLPILLQLLAVLV
jgi:hypothetical protein